MPTLEARLDRLEASMSEPTYHAEVEMIREKMKAKIPRLIEKADSGDDDALRLVASYMPDLESRLTELAESGRADARETLARLHRARAEREALLQREG